MRPGVDSAGSLGIEREGGPTLSTRIWRLGVGIDAAAAILLVAVWFDHRVLTEVQRTAATTFDAHSQSILLSVGYIAVAAGMLAIAVVGWWSRSTLLGAIYALVGGFLATLFFIVWQSAAALPGPIADAIGNLYFAVLGPLSAVPILGGGMFLVGVALIIAGLAGRMTAQTKVVTSAAVE